MVRTICDFCVTTDCTGEGRFSSLQVTSSTLVNKRLCPTGHYILRFLLFVRDLSFFRPDVPETPTTDTITSLVIDDIISLDFLQNTDFGLSFK